MAAHQPFRVLVVEDHEPCARLLQISLSGAGYRTVVVATVEEALFTLAEGSFAALVCDLLLPDGNGSDIAKVLTEKGDNLVKIAISGLLPTPCQAEAMASGFDAFLSKPFSPGDLVELLASCLLDEDRSLQ